MLNISIPDSRRFNFIVGRIVLNERKKIPLLISEAFQKNCTVIFITCPIPSWGIAQELERAGALLMETMVHYRHSLKGEDYEFPAQVELATRNDAKNLQKIATSAFSKFQNHYTSDDSLDKRLVVGIYPDLILRALNDKSVADAVFVVRNSLLDPIGFSSLKMDKSGKVFAVLYAVEPSSERKGVFRNLLQASIFWAKKNGGKYFEYTTQVANLKVNKSLTEVGFSPQSHSLIFHLWLNN